MSLAKLHERIEHYIKSDLPDYQFKKSLCDDCTVFFSTVPVKDWDREHIIAYIKDRYESLKQYVVSICRQNEIVDVLEDEQPTIELYIAKYRLNESNLPKESTSI